MNHNNAHCSDYIKREDAKRVLNKGLRYMRAFGVNRCLPMIYEVPSADVRENVRGKWIHDEITRNGNTVYTPNAKCSICDCYVFQESNFCPNCGSDMRPYNEP